MAKHKSINSLAFALAACAILSLVAIGTGLSYMLGWPAGIAAVGILVWVELSLFGKSHERDRRYSESGKSDHLAE